MNAYFTTSLLRVDHHRAHLDAIQASWHAGELGGQLQRLVRRGDVDDVEATEVLGHVGEGPVGHDAVLGDGPGRVGGLQRLAGHVHTRVAQRLGVGVVLTHDGAHLVFGDVLPTLGVAVDQ